MKLVALRLAWMVGWLLPVAGLATGASVARAESGPAKAAPADAARAEWAIDPPAGWHEDAAIGRQAIDKVTDANVPFKRVDVHVWVPDAQGTGLVLQWYVFEHGSDTELDIDQYDLSMMSGFAQDSTLDNRPQQIVGSMVIRDARADKLRGRPVQGRMVRRYQPATDGLHALIGMCTGTADIAPCSAALDGVRFTVPGAVSLGYASENSAGYRAGYFLGKLALPALVVGILFWLWRRHAAREAAALAATVPPGSPGGSEVTAAALPGPPPGPGGAGDGR